MIITQQRCNSRRVTKCQKRLKDWRWKDEIQYSIIHWCYLSLIVMVVNWWLNKDILQHEAIIINKHDYVNQSFCLELRIRKILSNLGVKYCVTKPLKCFAIQSNKSPWYLRLSYSMSICRDQNFLMTKRDQLTFALPRRYVKTLCNYEKNILYNMKIALSSAYLTCSTIPLT